MNNQKDFNSIPFLSEPKENRLMGLTFIYDEEPCFVKILLNSTDQKRAVRIIIRLSHSQTLDRDFSEIPSNFLIVGQFLVQFVSKLLIDVLKAKNVNVRIEDNNVFSHNERKGLHYHVLGRFENNTTVGPSIFVIDYEKGLTGDIPLGENKKPITKDQSLQLREFLQPFMKSNFLILLKKWAILPEFDITFE